MDFLEHLRDLRVHPAQLRGREADGAGHTNSEGDLWTLDARCMRALHQSELRNRWLAEQHFEQPAHQVLFQAYINTVLASEERFLSAEEQIT